MYNLTIARFMGEYNQGRWINRMVPYQRKQKIKILVPEIVKLVDLKNRDSIFVLADRSYALSMDDEMKKYLVEKLLPTRYFIKESNNILQLFEDYKRINDFFGKEVNILSTI